ncbi:dTDP-4-amino-4,6-dideoxygalactose transaminase [Halobacillus amylolyticus]|uniref:dTDP-4-amino-4,6-dideoxygalactose transaminase n=1 Tax=Halobacillus amylolyticus TaxID=2932259 RepID=A0ABY4HDQ3_9BACI|nr:dTDP-4-amino-4,6-dideoxygalactose transaminase [Halobacillus amylolyticus]UOR13031.1 dTDP-4-amino-4,6-dideoxygalactose transaminase [Halobacillus amylolyticus]
MIPFNKPCVIGKEIDYIQEAIHHNRKLSGNGPFGEKCKAWLEEHLLCQKALLTPSCTHALEMAALLLNIKEGDEIIMPSYTFVSTANAFVLRGAHITFVDVDPTVMNIDPELIEDAITPRTKAIVVVHYAGVACDMEQIMEMAERHQLFVIEDAAQALLSTYKGKPLGTFGHFGTLSFHETKNYTCGEGGALLINDPKYVERAEILQEKGTNRSQFKRGQVDKYTWHDVGSSFLLSELNAAYLYAQLEEAWTIFEDRIETWNRYSEKLSSLVEEDLVSTQHIPEGCQHNAHMFYIKLRTESVRSDIISYLKEQDIMAVPHYEPLHSSQAGRVYGGLSGIDHFTTSEAERLLRLPLYFGMEKEVVNHVVHHIENFFKK